MTDNYESQMSINHKFNPIDLNPNDEMDLTDGIDWNLGNPLPKFGRVCPVCHGHGCHKVWINGGFDADGCSHCNTRGYIINKELMKNA